MATNPGTGPPVRPGRAVSAELLGELQEELLFKTGKQWARAVSGSMAPLIRVDDRVLIERVKPERIQFGDVILFKSTDQRVVHRVIGKNRYLGRLTFLEKGDLNPALGLVPAEDVLGRVCVVRRDDHTVNLLSGRGRVMQVALAWCSVAPLILRWSLRRILIGLGLPRPSRRLVRLFDRATAALPRVVVKTLGSG